MLSCIVGLRTSYAATEAQPSVIDDKTVETWAVQAMKDIMSLDYMNIDAQKRDNRKYFTNAGYESFYEALDAAQITDRIKSKHLAVSPQVTCMPEIIPPPKEMTDAGVIRGTTREDGQTWYLQAPLTVIYTDVSSLKTKTGNDVVTLVVKRSGDPANGAQLAIDQWIETPDGSTECGRDKRAQAEIVALKAERDRIDGKLRELENSLTQADHR
jgi:hypothetical protein